LLEDSEDNIAGEARPSDGELPFIAIEEDMQIRDNDVEVTIEKANPIASEVPCNLVIRPSQSTAFSPIKMATPITTYEQLGPDKSKVKLPSSSKNLSAAAIKSVKLLSKYWGDEVNEEPDTDSTMDQDTDTESHRSLFESHSNIDKYLAKNDEPASTIKPGRKSKSTTNLEGTSSVRITTGSDDDKNSKSFTPYVSNRQKKKNKLQNPRESENECIQTRAKSGISKAYKS
jgi:hypothetical protein